MNLKFFLYSFSDFDELIDENDESLEHLPPSFRSNAVMMVFLTTLILAEALVNAQGKGSGAIEIANGRI